MLVTNKSYDKNSKLEQFHMLITGRWAVREWDGQCDLQPSTHVSFPDPKGRIYPWRVNSALCKIWDLHSEDAEVWDLLGRYAE